MAKFDLSNKSSKRTLGEKAMLLDNKMEFDFRQIPFDKIKVNEKNFYNVKDIEELANSIKENGLMHNIEVLEIIEDQTKYFKILSGERRYQAITKLRADGTKFDTIPCKVMRDLNEVDEEIHVIKGNSDTRIISEEERRLQIKKLNELYRMKNDGEGNKLNVKKEIAKELQISERSVERYNNINNKLIAPLQEFFDKKLITLTDASKFAILDEQMQQSILELLQGQSKISKDELEVLKIESKKIEEDRNRKEKALIEKEQLIERFTIEKEKIEQEKNETKIQLERIEEEKLLIEDKIKREIEAEKSEELELLKKELVKSNIMSNELVEKEKALTMKLTGNNNLLENKIKELKSELLKHNKISDEDIKKQIIKEKVKDIKNSVIKDIIRLADMIKSNELDDVTEDILIEIERSINVFKYKANEKK